MGDMTVVNKCSLEDGDGSADQIDHTPSYMVVVSVVVTISLCIIWILHDSLLWFALIVLWHLWFFRYRPKKPIGDSSDDGIPNSQTEPPKQQDTAGRTRGHPAIEKP